MVVHSCQTACCHGELSGYWSFELVILLELIKYLIICQRWYDLGASWWAWSQNLDDINVYKLIDILARSAVEFLLISSQNDTLVSDTRGRLDCYIYRSTTYRVGVSHQPEWMHQKHRNTENNKSFVVKQELTRIEEKIDKTTHSTQ